MKKKIVKVIAAAGIASLLVCPLSACNGIGDIINQIASQTSEPVSEPESESAVTSEIASDSDWEKPSGTEKGSETGSEKPGKGDVATEEDYLEFINGDAKIFVEIEGAEILEKGESYTLDEMVEYMNKELPEHWGPAGMEVSEVGYAIVDCANDKNPEMAIYVEAQTPDYYDGLTEYYIIKKMDGKLCVIANYTAQGRSWGELNKYGVFHSSGSGGAALHYGSYTRNNADGEQEFIYDCETTLGMEGPVLYGYELPSTAKLPDNMPQFPEDFGEYSREAYSFMEYTEDMYDDESKYDEYKKNKIYVFYDPDGNVCFPSDEDEKLYFDNGIRVTDADNLKEFLAGRLHDLGVTEEEMDFTSADYAPAWKVVRDYVHTEGQGGVG
ncbi:MAG: hypothetical protein IKO32_10645 [Lachnospiraceae bacterium]|nr:hypothetical protein [Lachnospiraceae bacterium]